MKLRQAGAVAYGIRKGDRVNRGELGTAITDLISWCRCGRRRSSAPWDRGLVSHGLCLGSWACEDRISRVLICFCQVRDKTVLQAACYI